MSEPIIPERGTQVAHNDGPRPEITVRNIFDRNGKPISVIPNPLSADFCKRAYMKGIRYEHAMDGTLATHPDLFRAQVPWLVTLLVYDSAFQLEETVREYVLYAPPTMGEGAKMARYLWTRWEGPSRQAIEQHVGFRSTLYPQMEVGVVADVLDDATFLDLRRATLQRDKKFKCAGAPTDPWAFTCLDGDIKLFQNGEFQHDLIHKLR